MARWRVLASLVVTLAFAGAARAQSHSLAETPSPDSCQRLQLSMTLTGTLKLQQDDQEIPLKESVTAVHDFVERVLESGPNGLGARSARLYKTANVSITVGSDKLQWNLRPERSLLIALRDQEEGKTVQEKEGTPPVGTRRRDDVLVCCPHGSLTRDEVDVTDHFDTLAITGLLPGKEVAVGATWTLHPRVAQALCHFQGLSEQALTVKLESVENGIASISVSGTATGVDLGAAVDSTIKATCQFDIQQHCLVSVEWNQKDERGPGPVSPASSMDTTIKLTRAPIENVNELSDVVLVPVLAWNGQPPRELLDVEFKDAKGRFELQHSRDWHLVGQTADHIVMRLMDRGEFVAQVSIAPWKKAEPGKHSLEEDVKVIVANSPGWAQDSLVGKCREVELPSKQWAFLVPGKGELDGVPAVQYFYFLAGPAGDQAMLTFTMTPEQTQKLGARDLEFVEGFWLPGTRQLQAEVKDGKR